MSTVILLLVTVLALVFSLYKDRGKTLESIKKAKGMMGGMISDIVGVLLLIGLILALIPEEVIRSLLGEGKIISSTIGAAIVGTITIIPAFVAFPLVGSLKDSGANIIALTAFLTTLTMVGFITFPLEMKTFGKKFALRRNLISFVSAIFIALCLGVLF
ncbi:MAG: hypothetical protein KAX49_07860 [Halanaerobiales bacterium]|nr:hypothetical protein [Halanaerobiales bacterium]